MLRIGPIISLFGLFVTTSFPATVSANSQDGLPTWRAELRFGPYQPQVSTVTENRDFYELMYASDEVDYMFDNRPIMTALGFETYPWRQFGLLGFGFRLGYWDVEGPARLCASALSTQEEPIYADCTPQSVEDSIAGNSNTKLIAFPLAFEVIYRFDHLKREYAIPLEFYARLGLDYAFWWAISNGEVSKSRDGSKEGKGGTAGFHGALGIALNLDWLEPQTAAKARQTSNMAGSYLFFEVNEIVADGFGEEKRLDMSATHYLVGLGIDFL